MSDARKTSARLVLAAALFIAACDERPHLAFDVIATDAGPLDATPSSDAETDAKAEDDDGGEDDLGITLDGAVEIDAFVDLDAGLTPDATVDIDAAIGIDAAADAAADATIEVDATSGARDATVAVDAAPDAATVDCTARNSDELRIKLRDERCTTITLTSGTFPGTFPVDRPVTLVGDGCAKTILDGDGSTTAAVITVAMGLSGTVTLENLAITGGGMGGIASLSPLVLDSVCVYENEATGGGGLGAMSNVTIRDSHFHDNIATLYGAGAAFYESATVGIYNTTFENNMLKASGNGGGGGIASIEVGTITIEDSYFDRNAITQTAVGRVSGAGAAFSDTREVRIARSSFNENTLAIGGDSVGGGIGAMVNNATVFVATRSTFNTNSGSGRSVRISGAGLAIANTRSATLEDSDVSENALVLTGTLSDDSPVGLLINGTSLTAKRTNITYNTLTITLSGVASPSSPLNVRGGGFSANGSSFDFDRMLIANNQLTATNPMDNIHLWGAGMAIQAWSGDTRGIVRNSAITQNVVSAVSTNPTFVTPYAFEGAGALVVAGNGYDNRVDFINTTVAANSLLSTGNITDVRMGSQVVADAREDSIVDVRFANASVVASDTLSTVASARRDVVMSQVRVELANSIVTNFGTPAYCTMQSGTNVVSRGYSLAPATCYPAIPTASDTVTAGPNVGAIVLTPAPHHPLSSSSPAVNGGNPSGCTEPDGTSITTDQLGLPRSGVCDVGAVEYGTP